MNGNAIRLTALMMAMLMLLAGCGKNKVEESETQTSQDNGFKIGYATEGVTVIDSEDSLQKAVDESYEKAKAPGIGLQYVNDAYSDDGINFECSIGNPEENEYDMFIVIYSDMDMEEMLFLSPLLRPGQKFEHITLEKSLASGVHQVVVGFTQVVEEDGEQKIHAQTAVTMDFHVR